MADLEKIAEELSKLTVLEASELSKILEEKWGVSAAAPVVAAAAPSAEGDTSGEEEKDSFGGGGSGVPPLMEKTRPFLLSVVRRGGFSVNDVILNNLKVKCFFLLVCS